LGIQERSIKPPEAEGTDAAPANALPLQLSANPRNCDATVSIPLANRDHGIAKAIPH
jgi:hypothetical protein